MAGGRKQSRSLLDGLGDLGVALPAPAPAVVDVRAQPTVAGLPAADGAVAQVLRVSPQLVSRNPRNPRTDFGDLSDLQSMAEPPGQLEPSIVVTTAAYQKLFPDDALDVGCDFVIVAGDRRRAATTSFGIDLQLIVRDDVAATQSLFTSVTVLENVHRKQFRPMEEARAVRALIEAFKADGSPHPNQDAGARLKMSPQVVSQRLNLLGLVPELAQVLEDKEGGMSIEAARNLGRLPADQQVAAWEQMQLERAQAVLARRRKKESGPGPADETDVRPPAAGRKPIRFSFPEGAGVREVREVLVKNLDRGTIERLIEELRQTLAEG